MEVELPESESSFSSTSFGTCSFKPRWLQKFANPKMYFIFHCLAGIIQGIYFTYLIGVLSTLEKRYSFDSSVTGIILIADNLSPLVASIVVGYYGKYIHRPRFIAFGMALIVICCFLSSFPYFLFGSMIDLTNISSKKEIELCFKPSPKENCDSAIGLRNYNAIAILFLANLLKGIGSTAFYTISIPYLDDNVKKNNSPLYLGATFAMRIFGPTLGFMLSSLCLKYYENPFIEPNFGVNDSRWIGAWWIGFLVIGLSLLLTSFPIWFFPNHMPNKPKSEIEEISHNHKSVSDFLLSVKKLIKNPILIFHTLSITFQINGLFGYFVFMPKYIENQYRNSASTASFFSGTITLIATVPSVFLGGVAISKFKPGPKSLTGYMLFVQVLAGTIMLAALFMNCESSSFSENESFLYYRNQECNSMCTCSQHSFNPVCDTSGNTHFSACSAGCLTSEIFNKAVLFKNCSCVHLPNTTNEDIQVSKGICSEDCYKFLPYIISITISKLFASTSRVGNILVTLRCVDEKDKTLALGAVETFLSVFATIPHPLLYGYVIDKSCLLWDEKCDRRGSCLFYGNDLFRYYLHGLSISFIFLGVCCDFVVFLFSNRMANFYDDSKKISNYQNVEFVEINNVEGDH